MILNDFVIGVENTLMVLHYYDIDTILEYHKHFTSNLLLV